MKSFKLHRGWVVFVGICLYYFIAFGLLYSSFGLFLSPMSEELGISYASLSLTTTVRILCGSAVTGFMAAVYRKANLRAVLGAATALLAVSIFLLSIVSALWQIMLLFAAVGLFCGVCLYSTIPVILNRWFKAPAALISIAMASGGLGGVVITPIMTNIIHLYGWRIGYIVMAAGVLAIMCPIASILMDYAPEKRGLTAVENAGRKAAKKPNMSFAAQNGTAYNTANLVLCGVFFFFASLASGLYVHISSALFSKGFDVSSAAMFISIFQLGTMLFQFLPGFISSWTGPNKVLFVSLPLLILGSVSGIVINNGSSFIVVAATMLLLGGARMFTSFGSVYARYVFGSEQFDKAFSKLQICNLVGSALSTFIYGALYQMSGSYTPAFLLSAACVVIVLVTTFMLKGRVDNNKSKLIMANN